MKTNPFVGLLFCCLLTALPLSAKVGVNFIVIVADDLGYGDLSCYGNKDINTPVLDALADGGIRFTDFHTNGPVCSPTRAALMTGAYQQRVGISGVIKAKSDRDHGLATTEMTMAKYMRSLGYTTGMFGKWHLGYDAKFNPVNHGFDEYCGFVAGNVDYHSHVDQEGYEDWWSGDSLMKEKGYTTDLITAHSIDFIKRHKDEDFFLYIPHEAPHYPYQGRDSKADRQIGGTLGKDFKAHGSATDVPPLYKEMIEVMDEGIGQLLNELKLLDLEKKTFVLFLADNGAAGHGCNLPLRGVKGTLWEGAHRVPAIASWPSVIAPEQINEQTIMTMDIFPTFVDIAKGDVPQYIDGVSMKDVILEGEAAIARDIYWEFNGKKAIRRGDWKLIVNKKNTSKQLFNLKDDLSEKINVSSQHLDLVDELSKKIDLWFMDVSKSTTK